ncbi:MAG: DedA family protein [Blastocatellia bacterium]|nr:DedA family protein [Blastocatellia bacterium]
MEFLKYLIDLVLHLDRHLGELLQQYGSWTYVILFAIIFCETGLVVTPFLPGDSLLFAVGALAAATGQLNPLWVFGLLSLAAILGDTTNYWIGNRIGPKVFQKEDSLLFNKNHLVRTQKFYEKYGRKTIIIARFVPIVRTFAPFVAGIGKMPYSRFIAFSLGGGMLWIGSLVYAGYFFGGHPFVKKNFSLVIVMIVFISVLPAVIEFWRHRQEEKKG